MKKRDRVAIVTGGTRGIGSAVARRFCEAGWRVVIGARTDNGYAKVLGPRARFVSTDAARAGDHARLVATALAIGELDAYVNCAGFSAWRPLDLITEEFLDAMIATNLKGVVFGCQAAAAAMKRGGVIINVSSLAGKRGSANNAAYCATKFAVNGITQALAKELGPRGIRVNAVCPVYVRTAGVMKALAEGFSPAAGRPVARYLADFARESSALGKLPTGDQVAEVCFFLASPASGAVTGQCVNVDCGVLPQ